MDNIIKRVVYSILHNDIQVRASGVKPSFSLSRDLGITGIDFDLMLYHIEWVFNITINGEEITDKSTVEELVLCVSSKLKNMEVA